MIRNVVFDIGNVLTDFRWKEYMFDLGFDQAMVARIAAASVKTPYWDEFDRGAWTEEEQAQHREKLGKMYADQRTERSGIRERLLTYTPEEFAAESAYMLSREEPTQNAEGVHVGDILYSSWGWEQTNIDFYQVVGLRGKHTLILRELAAASGEDSHMTGLKRPRRDVFRNDKQYTVRSKFTSFSPDVPYILDPTLSTGVTLHPVEFGKLYDFSTYA